MTHIDEIWLATEQLDMRAGPDKALARIVQVFGSARPHCDYLFANKRGNRIAQMTLTHFAELKLDRLPDETTILNFRHFLEQHGVGKAL